MRREVGRSRGTKCWGRTESRRATQRGSSWPWSESRRNFFADVKFSARLRVFEYLQTSVFGSLHINTWVSSLFEKVQHFIQNFLCFCFFCSVFCFNPCAHIRRASLFFLSFSFLSFFCGFLCAHAAPCIPHLWTLFVFRDFDALSPTPHGAVSRMRGGSPVTFSAAAAAISCVWMGSAPAPRASRTS